MPGVAKEEQGKETRAVVCSPSSRAMVLFALVFLGVLNILADHIQVAIVIMNGITVESVHVYDVTEVRTDSSKRAKNRTMAPPKSPDRGSSPAPSGISKYPMCTRAAVGREPYVCEGPDYEKFADRLEQFILWSHGENNTMRSYVDNDDQFNWFQQSIRTRRNQRPTWGQRKNSPFPDNSLILAFGSSHTRSIFSSIACQYPVLEDVELMIDNVTFPVRRGAYYRYEFVNHAKLHLVTNHDLVYSYNDWQNQLEDLVEHKLSDFDVLFYGRFNDKYHKTETDETVETQGINLTTIANAYPGPIVGHTLIADWYFYATDMTTFTWQRNAMSPERARSIALIDGRHYFKALGHCSTDEWKTAGVCESAENKHACLGKRGGHADLIAWDMIEAMYEVLNVTKVK